MIRIPFVSDLHVDDLAQLAANGDSKSYLIAGAGDGGLIDLIRLRIKDFQQEDFVRRFYHADPDDSEGYNLLADRLGKIELRVQIEFRIGGHTATPGLGRPLLEGIHRSIRYGRANRPRIRFDGLPPKSP